MSEVTQPTALEKQLSNAVILAERRQMVARLQANRDFRKLILDGFCLVEAARYVQESCDPAMTIENRTDALNMAQASGHLLRFLEVTSAMGAHAERTMKELEDAVAEERAGQDDSYEVGAE